MLLTPASRETTDRLTGTVVRSGNTVTLLPSGEESYAKRWELIEAAERSLHMVSFSFMRDDTTQRLADVVREKLAAGVEVRMIVDDAALYTTFSRKILRSMADAGAEVLTYNSPWRYLAIRWSKGHPIRQLVRGTKVAIKRRYHEKFLVADGTEAVLGGMNWGTKYALGGTDDRWWRDTDAHLTGPVVADVQRRFLVDLFVFRALRDQRWARPMVGLDPEAFLVEARRDAEAFLATDADRYFPPLPSTGAEEIRYVGHKPWDENHLPLTDVALQMIREAQRSIYWGCHGVRPPRIFAESLAEAVERGVEVHLLTNSSTSSRSLMGRGLLGWMYWECSNHFRWLVERGIHVHEWQKPGAFHSKNLVVDDEVAGVGSYNVANGSAFHHTESAIFVYGGAFPKEVRRQFEVDLQDCREVTLATTKRPWRLIDPMRRPLHERNLLIEPSLLPEAVARDLAAGKVTWKYADAPSSPTPR